MNSTAFSFKRTSNDGYRRFAFLDNIRVAGLSQVFAGGLHNRDSIEQQREDFIVATPRVPGAFIPADLSLMGGEPFAHWA